MRNLNHSSYNDSIKQILLMKTIGNVWNFWVLPKEPQKDLGNILNKQFFYYYYIDTSVLLENIPLVKFIKTTSGTRVVYESWQITLRARALRKIFLDLSTGRSKGFCSQGSIKYQYDNGVPSVPSVPSVTEYFKQRFYWLVRKLI